jgi:FMN phosphatase YigB (HAD superfamily)
MPDNMGIYNIGIGSYCFEKKKYVKPWHPSRWNLIRRKYGLPTSHTWRFDDRGNIVILVAKIGGWKNLDRNITVAKYRDMILGVLEKSAFPVIV